jgi:hypothetical protein
MVHAQLCRVTVGATRTTPVVVRCRHALPHVTVGFTTAPSLLPAVTSRCPSPPPHLLPGPHLLLLPGFVRRRQRQRRRRTDRQLVLPRWREGEMGVSATVTSLRPPAAHPRPSCFQKCKMGASHARSSVENGLDQAEVTRGSAAASWTWSEMTGCNSRT